MGWNDDAIYHRIRAHKSDPNVYDPPTFEQMADRIEKLIAENKRINDQITEKQHAAKNRGDNMTKFTAEQQALLEDAIDFSSNGAVTYNGDLAKVVGDVWGDVQGSIQGNVCGDVQGDVQGNLQGDLGGDLWGNAQCSIQGDVWGDVQGDVRGNLGGNLWGNVQGSVQGDVQGNVRGNVRGDVWGNVKPEQINYGE